jgi:hypothetical protein
MGPPAPAASLCLLRTLLDTSHHARETSDKAFSLMPPSPRAPPPRSLLLPHAAPFLAPCRLALLLSPKPERVSSSPRRHRSSTPSMAPSSSSSWRSSASSPSTVHVELPVQHPCRARRGGPRPAPPVELTPLQISTTASLGSELLLLLPLMYDFDAISLRASPSSCCWRLLHFHHTWPN